MSRSQVTVYADDLRSNLSSIADPVDPTRLTKLKDAASELAVALNPPGPTPAAWNAAVANWEAARDAIVPELKRVMLGPLASTPILASQLPFSPSAGFNGAAELGPVRIEVDSASLVVQAPGIATPLVVGPYPIGQVAVALSTPVHGGGTLLRLDDKTSYGGMLLLPLGLVQVSAAAVLGGPGPGPSFLAVLGAAFTPPIQLSFGFSLDRVGGILGVNRRIDSDALTAAVRTGWGGDALFAIRPPAKPLDLVTALDRLFPTNTGTHLFGPSLRLAWGSLGSEGSVLGLDIAVVVQIPTGKVVIVGVAHAGLPPMLNLRLDLVGIADPVQQLASVDASLVDSHMLGAFAIHGDAAMRFSWGSNGYTVVSVGGFYPGFNPEPARLPAMRRAAMSLDNPVRIVDIRAEAYLAITSNTLQLGGRLEIGFDKGIEAHGFVQLDVLMQFLPLHFEARFAAGFRVSVKGRCFASVGMDGTISGPGPITIDGRLSIRLFLFKISWHETFRFGSGQAKTLPAPPDLLDLIAAELGRTENVHAGSVADPEVVLKPRQRRAGFAAVPPTGTLVVSQRRAPLGLLIDRVDGRPLMHGGRPAPRGVKIVTVGPDVTDRFSPGGYVNLTSAEALHRPAFDVLACGRELIPPDPAFQDFPSVTDDRKVRQVVVIDGVVRRAGDGKRMDIADLAQLSQEASRPPTLGDATPLITATAAQWTAGGRSFDSATAAHQHARYNGGAALAAEDTVLPIRLSGIL